jgi:hypothetical protein
LLLIPAAFLVFWVCGRGQGRLVWKVLGYVVLSACSIPLVLSAFSGRLGDDRFNDRLNSLEPTAQDILNDPGTSGSGCFTPGGGNSKLDYAGLGEPDEICVSVSEDRGNGTRRRVLFTWGVRSLVFEGATPHPSISQCFRHLRDEWWAQIEDDPNCPVGFTYTGL